MEPKTEKLQSRSKRPAQQRLTTALEAKRVSMIMAPNATPVEQQGPTRKLRNQSRKGLKGKKAFINVPKYSKAYADMGPRTSTGKNNLTMLCARRTPSTGCYKEQR